MREHAGDVDEEIGGADDFRTLRLSQAEPLGLPGKAVRPLVGQPVTRHESGQVRDVELAAFTYPSLVGIVGPLSGVFQVVHVVTEARQAEDILEVVPGYSPQGILCDEPSHDNTQRRNHLGPQSYAN